MLHLHPRRALLKAMMLIAIFGFSVSTLQAASITNRASGTAQGISLDTTQASVTLDRVGGVVTSATAEIWPNSVLSGQVGQPFTYDIMPTILAGDTGFQSMRLAIPAGFANVGVASLTASGIPLGASCPAPGAAQFCATFGSGNLEILLGDKVTADQSAIRLTFTSDTPAGAGARQFVASLVDGARSVSTTEGNADGDSGDANSVTVEVSQTQGLVLQLEKRANKSEAMIGEVVTYEIAVRNTQSIDIVSVSLDDRTPPAFKYLPGSTRVNGAPAPDPLNSRPLQFALGRVPAWNDLDLNGAVDPGEPGYVMISYQLVVGAGAVPGDHINSAVARDFCETCQISNSGDALVRVKLDPLFDLGTIIGKVFDDRNGDGIQGKGEPGIAAAMVALDDGTYSLTDGFGRYHFPAVVPGNRLLKVNFGSLPPGSEPTTDRRRVVSVTPGLLARANFGVKPGGQVERIGRSALHGVAVIPGEFESPVALQGNAENLTVLINGFAVPLHTRGVRMRLNSVEDLVQINGGRVEGEPAFEIDGDALDQVESWELTIQSSAGELVRKLDGIGPVPARIEWDARDRNGELLEAGAIYRYRLRLRYTDGTRATSALRAIGVNRSSVVSLTLTGDAFASGNSVLTPQAKAALSEVAEAMGRFPEESVVVEGHTDSVGPASANLALSLRRAEAARDFLVESVGVSPSRLMLRGRGEEQPVATNGLPEGRALNRRVEVRGEFKKVDQAALLDVPRGTPAARVNGLPLEPDRQGRFRTSLEDPTVSSVDLSLSNTQGRQIEAVVQIPTIAVDWPTEPLLIPDGSRNGDCRFRAEDGPLFCSVRGRTEPGNAVTLDGSPLPVAADGTFGFDAALDVGTSTFALIARDGVGVARFANLRFRVTDRDDEGRLLVAVEPVPTLVVTLPPAALQLATRSIALSGSTDSGNSVRINGDPVSIDDEGRFETTVELPVGSSKISIEVEDPQGRIGRIERDVRVARHQLFLLALAEGKVGKFEADGALAEGRIDDSEDLFTEGRLAFYLKGTISGKVLITSAYDSGHRELEPLFGDLDQQETERLLTELDPDRVYPVYGDASTVVNDVESRGRFYLAVDSETMHGVVGNYPLQLTDVELARYQRTLYGARFDYRSASVTSQGRPATEVVLFAAELEQAQVQNELRATGGSLYYLSHRDLIEGSEQITRVVRDDTTGLVLERHRQQRGVDYTIKYPEGRVMFQRPIASVALGGSTTIGGGVLDGHPVYLQVNFETRLPSVDKTASGARLRTQIGDRLSIGTTYLDDEGDSGPYELEAVDLELRAGNNSRFTAEIAHSRGNDSRVYFSDDGGLSYNEVSTVGSPEGSAWKATAELDLGEWFGNPGRHTLKLYAKELEAGFLSNGNRREQGSLKAGAIGRFEITARDTIELRHESDERDASDSTSSSILWRHKGSAWNLETELFSIEAVDGGGTVLRKAEVGAVRFDSKLGKDWIATLEHRQTLSGQESDRSSAGIRYRVTDSLAFDLTGSRGDRGESAQLGATYDIDTSSIYLTERLLSDAAGRRTSTVFGTRAPLGESSQIYTEYQLERADAGDRAISLLGLQRQWDPAPRYRIRLSGETAKTESLTGDDRRTAVSTGISYSNPDGLTVHNRSEIRLDSGTSDRRQWNSFSKLDYKIDPSLTVLARHRYSKSEDRSAAIEEARFEERVLGLAYRPVKHDRFNLLAKYTRSQDRRPDTTVGQTRRDRTMDIVAVEAAYQISPRFEWLAKAANRSLDEHFLDRGSLKTQSILFIHRGNFRLRAPFDLSVEYRVLSQRQAQDRSQGWLGELSWRLHDHFRVGAGYNFTDFSDDEFAEQDGSMQGWFLRLQGVY